MHAFLEHLFQPVPGVGRTFAGLAHGAFHGIAHGLGLAAGGLARDRLQRQAFLDQGLEQLGAFGLRASEGADSGQPDLLGRLAQALGQLLGLGLRGFVAGSGSGLLACGFLQRGHGVPSVVSVGIARQNRRRV